MWLAVSRDHRRGRDAHSEHSTFSSRIAHCENWKDCAISSSWIRQSRYAWSHNYYIPLESDY